MSYTNFTEEAITKNLVKGNIQHDNENYLLLEAFDSKSLTYDWVNELVKYLVFPRNELKIRKGNFGCYGIYVKE